jgi:hypothetical protein
MQINFTQQFYEILERKKTERGWMGNFADRYGIAQSVLSKIISHESENPRLSNVAKIVDGLIADGDWHIPIIIRDRERSSDISQLMEKVDAFEKEVDLLHKNNAALEKSNVALEKSNVTLEKIVKLMEDQTEAALIEKQHIIDSLNTAVGATERESQSLRQQCDRMRERLELVQGEKDALETEKYALLEKMHAEKAQFEAGLSSALSFAEALKKLPANDGKVDFIASLEEAAEKLDWEHGRDSSFFLSIFLQLERLREQIILRGILKPPLPPQDEPAGPAGNIESPG